MKKLKYKVFAYITHNNRLFVFRHIDFPEAGIQVPAGTMKENESAEQAVLREAFEETGLATLTLDIYLGEQVRDMADFGRDEIHYRRFYHLRCEGTPPAYWRHEEFDPSGDSEAGPIAFELFWVSLPHDVPPIIADHNKMLPQLLNRLALEN